MKDRKISVGVWMSSCFSFKNMADGVDFDTIRRSFPLWIFPHGVQSRRRLAGEDVVEDLTWRFLTAIPYGVPCRTRRSTEDCQFPL